MLFALVYFSKVYSTEVEWRVNAEDRHERENIKQLMEYIKYRDTYITYHIYIDDENIILYYKISIKT